MKSKVLFLFSALAITLCTVLVSFAYATQIETLNVDVLSSRVLVFALDEGVRVNGSLSISGGSENDIDFYVTDPNGSRIVDLGRVKQQATFQFITQGSGAYTLRFDNSFSWLNPKVVSLSYEVEGETPLNPIKPQNVQISIMFEAVIIIALISLAIGAAILLRHGKNKPASASALIQ